MKAGHRRQQTTIFTTPRKHERNKELLTPQEQSAYQ